MKDENVKVKFIQISFFLNQQRNRRFSGRYCFKNEKKKTRTFFLSISISSLNILHEILSIFMEAHWDYRIYLIEWKRWIVWCLCELFSFPLKRFRFASLLNCCWWTILIVISSHSTVKYNLPILTGLVKDAKFTEQSREKRISTVFSCSAPNIKVKWLKAHS